MSETNRDDISIAGGTLLTNFIPHYGIDLRVILLSLSNELVRKKITFGPYFTDRTDVIVPTLKHRFYTKPVRGYLIVSCRSKIKIPMETDKNGLSLNTIEILCEYLEKIEINYPIF